MWHDHIRRRTAVPLTWVWRLCNSLLLSNRIGVVMTPPPRGMGHLTLLHRPPTHAKTQIRPHWRLHPSFPSSLSSLSSVYLSAMTSYMLPFHRRTAPRSFRRWRLTKARTSPIQPSMSSAGRGSGVIFIHPQQCWIYFCQGFNWSNRGLTVASAHEIFSRGGKCIEYWDLSS